MFNWFALQLLVIHVLLRYRTLRLNLFRIFLDANGFMSC